MAQTLTYSIVDWLYGRFDLVAHLGSGSLHACAGFLTLGEVKDELVFLQVLMTAFGAPVVRAAGSKLLSSG